MAYCTKCSREIDNLAVKCTHCGYDFAEAARDPSTQSWEFTAFGDFVLMCSGVICAITAVITGIGSVIGIFACLFRPSRIDEILPTLINLLIAWCVTTSHWIIVQRVSRLKAK